MPCNIPTLAITCAMAAAGLAPMQMQRPPACAIKSEARMTAISGLPGVEGWHQGNFGLIPAGADYVTGLPLMAGHSSAKNLWPRGVTLQQWAQKLLANWHEPSDLSCHPVIKPGRNVHAERLPDITGANGVTYLVYAVSDPPLLGRTLVAFGDDGENFLRFFLIGSKGDFSEERFAFASLLNQVGTSLR